MKKVTINLSNRLTYTLIVIAVLIVAVGIINAYNSGGPPSYFGHSADEIEGVIGGGMAFGDWQPTTFDTTHQATSDGIAFGWMEGNTYPYAYGYTDSSQTAVNNEEDSVKKAEFRNQHGYSHPNPNVPVNVVMPVKEGDYWRIKTGSTYGSDVRTGGELYWLPLAGGGGSGGGSGGGGILGVDPNDCRWMNIDVSRIPETDPDSPGYLYPAASGKDVEYVCPHNYVQVGGDGGGTITGILCCRTTGSGSPTYTWYDPPGHTDQTPKDIGQHDFCAVGKVGNAEDSHYCSVYKEGDNWYIKQYKTGCSAVCMDF